MRVSVRADRPGAEAMKGQASMTYVIALWHSGHALIPDTRVLDRDKDAEAVDAAFRWLRLRCRAAHPQAIKYDRYTVWRLTDGVMRDYVKTGSLT